MKILAIGEVLWDSFNNSKFIGGAPLNFGLHSKILGNEVFIVSAVGKDLFGDELIAELVGRGLSTRFIHRSSTKPTGLVEITLKDANQPQYLLKTPAAYDDLAVGIDLKAITSVDPEWVYFGTMCQMSDETLKLTQSIASNTSAKRFYDVNLRPTRYSAELIEELFRLATVVKLNAEEVSAVLTLFGEGKVGLETFCRQYSRKFAWDAVCVTKGEQGCCLLVKDEFVESESYRVDAVDAVGAGDAFSAALVYSMSLNWPAREIADFSNRTGSLIAGRRGATPVWTLEEVMDFRNR